MIKIEIEYFLFKYGEFIVMFRTQSKMELFLEIINGGKP